MTGAPSVAVIVDGRPLPDGCLQAPTVNPDDPEVLSGLTVRWGRSDSIDQPAPAVCSFEAVDVDPATRFTDRLYVGADVIVNADASTWGAPTIDTIAAPLNLYPTNGTVHGANARHAVIHPVKSDRSVTVTITPLPQSPDPTAWDTVPRTAAGQQWRLTIAAAASWHPTTVTVHPVAFAGPQPGAKQTVLPAVDVTSGSALFVPPAGYWIGIRVEWYPTGPTWDGWTPAAQTWDEVDPALTWDTISELTIDNAQVTAPAAGVVRTAQVFRGRITDLTARWDLDVGATVVDVVAADLMADLANRPVGAEPWPAETLPARWARIGAALTVPVVSTLPPSVAAVQVTRRDVDNQPAATLYQELARSVDGQVAVVSHIGTGPTLELDTMRDRPALMTLALSPTGTVVVVPSPTAAATVVSACRVDLDPVEWSQTVADLATRVAVGWNDQTTTPQTTARTATATDPALDAAIGAHRVAVSTQLTTSGDASALAAAMLARMSRRGWTVTGLRLNLGEAPLSPDDLAAALTLMDATSRLSAPISLTDLPAWSPVARGPVSLFLEGGTYRSRGGVWELDLSTTSAAATGAADLTWDDLDASWSWDQFDPSVRWDDLTGVGK